jgi:hypothetical protein
MVRDYYFCFIYQLLKHKVHTSHIAKTLKLDVPKYFGSSNVDVFDKWLKDLLHFLRLQDMTECHRCTDSTRIELVEEATEGSACTWFEHSVIGLYSEVCRWTFKDVIWALYSYFVGQASHLNADRDWHNLRYSGTEGQRATGFFMDFIITCASCMVTPPSGPEFKHKFFRGLLRSCQKHLIEDNCLPELVNCQKLWHHAIRWEKEQDYLDFYLNRHIDATSNNNSHPPSRGSIRSSHSGGRCSTTLQPSNNNHTLTRTTQTTTTSYYASGPSVHFEWNQYNSCSPHQNRFRSGQRDQSYNSHKTPYPSSGYRDQRGSSPYQSRSSTYHRYYPNNNYNAFSCDQGRNGRTFPPRSPSPHPSCAQNNSKPTDDNQSSQTTRPYNRNNSLHETKKPPRGKSPQKSSSAIEQQYALQDDGDSSSGGEDEYNLPNKSECCSSLCEVEVPVESYHRPESLAHILEFSAGMQEEYLMAKEESSKDPNSAYSQHAIPVEELDAWCPVSIPPSIYLDVPNMCKIWCQTGVNIKQNRESMKAVLDPVQLYAARCRAIKKKTVGTMSRPKCSHEINRCLCIIMSINGVNAYILCDTGCTTDAISPAFTEACQLDIFDLDSVIGL